MMTTVEARCCVETIKGHLGNIRQALLELDEREGWRALGYPSLRECMVAEFGASQRRLYRELSAAKIERQICPTGQLGVLPERHARELSRLDQEQQRVEAYEEAVELAEDHGLTASWIRRAVERKIAVTEGRPAAPEVAALPSGKFSVILADPPWRYDFSNTSGRAVEQHYSTMDLDSIKSMPVADLAADGCICFLWGTAPKLPEALEVLSVWGFTYKTCLIWHKSGLGMGYYSRVDHELLLIGTRGSPGIPAAADRVSSVHYAEKTRHSEKPDVFRELIERMYPNAQRIELFCRSPREGWSVWGDQVG